MLKMIIIYYHNIFYHLVVTVLATVVTRAVYGLIMAIKNGPGKKPTHFLLE